MKKKNQKTTDSSAAALIPTRSTADLKALIQSHSDFFDRLIELIPARFYLPPDDDVSDNPKPYFHGLSKAAKASLKRQSKQNLKLARRNRLDPDKISHSSTLDLLKQSLDTSAHGGEVAEIPPQDVPRAIDLEEKNGGDGNDGEKGQEKQVTYEELREKLRKKIESLRGNRGEGIGVLGRGGRIIRIEIIIEEKRRERGMVKGAVGRVLKWWKMTVKR
nr:uncharacterized protein LOC113738889 [Coffea arabica]